MEELRLEEWIETAAKALGVKGVDMDHAVKGKEQNGM